MPDIAANFPTMTQAYLGEVLAQLNRSLGGDVMPPSYLLCH
jgi:hypothetical protein